jgi:tryptophan synthase alpha chain
MNRIQQLVQKDGKLLSLYYTAGYPNLEDTVPILKSIQDSGVDMVEIGLPFSDPLADGPTIQQSSTQALKNGMTTEKLFQQLENVRKDIHLPLLLMGYFNPVLQYGVEHFCERCETVGIDGLILPDLPLKEYQAHYAPLFKKHQLSTIFLITPQTSEDRIRAIDKASDAFIYMVSSASVTGAKTGFGEEQRRYFERVAAMNLKNPLIVGFGISNSETFLQATQTTKGAIIGSAFIKHLTQHGNTRIPEFVASIRGIV